MTCTVFEPRLLNNWPESCSNSPVKPGSQPVVNKRRACQPASMGLVSSQIGGVESRGSGFQAFLAVSLEGVARRSINRHSPVLDAAFELRPTDCLLESIPVLVL